MSLASAERKRYGTAVAFGLRMQYSYIPTTPKSPAFNHEFDSRVMPGRRWEPGVTISTPKNKKQDSNTDRSKNEVPGKRNPIN